MPNLLENRGKLLSRTGHWSVRDINFLGFLRTRSVKTLVRARPKAAKRKSKRSKTDAMTTGKILQRESKQAAGVSNPVKLWKLRKAQTDVLESSHEPKASRRANTTHQSAPYWQTLFRYGWFGPILVDFYAEMRLVGIGNFKYALAQPYDAANTANRGLTVKF